MIRLTDHLVLLKRMTPVAARLQVLASWTADEQESPQHLWIEGAVKGPLCEYSTTLSGETRLEPEFVAEQASPSSGLKASAEILDPCFWEPQHPFCYEVDLELHDDDRLLDMRRIITGLRHLAVEEGELLLNGQDFFLEGVGHPAAATIAQLEAWHDVGCAAFLVEAPPELCARTDRWGPMILHLLPQAEAEAVDQVTRLRNHPSVLMWVVPAQLAGEQLDTLIKTIRQHDPSRPIGQLAVSDQPLPAESALDLFFLPAGHPAIRSTECGKPIIVLGRMTGHEGRVNVENFGDEIARLREHVGSHPGLAGLIL